MDIGSDWMYEVAEKQAKIKKRLPHKHHYCLVLKNTKYSIELSEHTIFYAHHEHSGPLMNYTVYT